MNPQLLLMRKAPTWRFTGSYTRLLSLLRVLETLIATLEALSRPKNLEKRPSSQGQSPLRAPYPPPEAGLGRFGLLGCGGLGLFRV